MLPEGGMVEFRPLSPQEARWLAEKGLESAVGHEATAQVFSEVLGVAVPANRVQVTLSRGDFALLGSLNARLPEGKVLSRSEMAAFPIRWLLVRVVDMPPLGLLEELYHETREGMSGAGSKAAFDALKWGADRIGPFLAALRPMSIAPAPSGKKSRRKVLQG